MSAVHGRLEAILLKDRRRPSPEPFTLHAHTPQCVEDDDGKRLVEVRVHGKIWLTEDEWKEAVRTLERLAKGDAP